MRGCVQHEDVNYWGYIQLWLVDGRVWSNGGMLLTGENWSAGRKTLYSVGGRWMDEYGAMVEWYWQGKTEVLREKHYTAWVVDGWMGMEQWWNDNDKVNSRTSTKNLSQYHRHRYVRLVTICLSHDTVKTILKPQLILKQLSSFNLTSPLIFSNNKIISNNKNNNNTVLQTCSKLFHYLFQKFWNDDLVNIVNRLGHIFSNIILFVIIPQF